MLLIMIAMAKFSAFAGDPSMLAMLDSMPTAMLDALNMRAFNLTTVSGFFGIMFVYFALLGAIAAAMWGSDIISKEERDKTVEFSLVLPVSRSRVVTAKALAALVNCILLVLITWGVSLVAVRSYSPDAAFYKFLALEMRAMFSIELIFLAVGLLLGCAMKQYKRSGFGGGGHHPGGLLHVGHLRHAGEPGLPEVAHALQILRCRRTLPHRPDGRHLHWDRRLDRGGVCGCGLLDIQ